MPNELDGKAYVDRDNHVLDLTNVLVQRRRLIRAAAYASGCTTALFLAREPTSDHPSIPSIEFGIIDQADAEWIADTIKGAELQSDHSDAEEHPGWRCYDAVRVKMGSSLWLLASAEVYSEGGLCGHLALATSDKHPGLTPAQLYVFKTHAAQVGLLLTFDTMRRRGLADLELTTERLRLLESVAVHANDAILITEAEPIDLPGPRILYCNAAFTHSTGYAQDDVIGRSPRLLQGPETSRVTLDILRGKLAAWEPVVAELVNYRKDGTQFWIELSIVPVANEAGWFTHWVSVQRDISDRKTAEDAAHRARIAESEKQTLESQLVAGKLVEARLFHAAFHDDLTKLPNRAFFMKQLATAIGRADASRSDHLALLFLDLNRFKSINDTLGHGHGDALLAEVARRLSACVRPSDVVARMGGDEFALLIDVFGGSSAIFTVANRITQAIEEPFRLGRQELLISCSIGAVQHVTHYLKPEDALRDADIAMYRAKQNGSSSCALFTDIVDAQALMALELEADLRPALERGDFLLYYQPVFDHAGKISAFEALVRWQHPRFGLLQPEAFIPIAEQVGLIRPLGRWVMQEGVRQVQEWLRGIPNITFRLNVNVSTRELLDETFVSDVLETLEAAGLLPQFLELEITETVLLERSHLALQTLEKLRRLGVRLALDDFGTGYSSLGYLDTYPIDTLKIDRSFVAGMLEHGRTRAIVETILRLADALDLDCVAEGVESDEQRLALVEMGCRYLQGYHLARPLDSVAAQRLLSRADISR